MFRKKKLNVETHFLIAIVFAIISKLLLDKYRSLVKTIINVTCFLNQMRLPTICQQ